MQVDEGSFVRNKEALVQKYQNANMSPDRHASYLRLRALKQMWRMEDVLSELQASTPASVQVYCSHHAQTASACRQSSLTISLACRSGSAMVHTVIQGAAISPRRA